MDHTRITLRIPTDVALWIKAEAVKNRRSFNGEIVARVEKEKLEQEQKEKHS